MAESAGETEGAESDSVLPETFRQRGLAVPFTTRILSFARYRRSQGAADVLVPGLGGGTEVYLIPFKTLPKLFSLTVYDRALHDRLAQLHDPDPLTIRETALGVAESGLAGPDPMRRARDWRERRVVLGNKILFALLRAAVTQLGERDAAVHDMDERALASPEGLTAARDALKSYARGVAVSANDVISRLEAWAEIILPAGAPDDLGDGPLVERLDEIEALATELTAWLANEPPDTAEMAQRTAAAARATARMARVLVERLHAPAADMATPLMNWEASRYQLERRVERLAHLVDGWQRILDMWATAKRGDRIHQRDVLETLAPHVPVLPQELVGADSFWTEMRHSQARWLSTSRNRVDAEIDSDTRDKLAEFAKETA